jgi:hypothetical protein
MKPIIKKEYAITIKDDNRGSIIYTFKDESERDIFYNELISLYKLKDEKLKK